VLGSFVALLEPVLLILQPIRLILQPVRLIPVATVLVYGAGMVTNRSVDTLTKADLKGKKVFRQGGFGPVYCGQLEDSREVTVKLLGAGLQQGVREFCNEATLQSRVQQHNILVGLALLFLEAITMTYFYSLLFGSWLDKGEEETERTCRESGVVYIFIFPFCFSSLFAMPSFIWGFEEASSFVNCDCFALGFKGHPMKIK
jgi:hypothetical protein